MVPGAQAPPPRAAPGLPRGARRAARLLDGPDIGDADTTLFDAALARYGDLDGFLSLCWLVDGRSGNGLGITTWRTADHLRASEALNHRVRRDVETTFACRVDSVLDVQTLASVCCPDGADTVLDLREPSPSLN